MHHHDSPPSVEKASQGLKALIIDDDPSFCLLTTSILDSIGIQTLFISDSDGAHEAIASYKPDLILCDLFMPGTDGMQILRAEMPSNPKPKIIAMTGCVLGETNWVERMAKGLGAHYFLKKPFGPQDLWHVVEELFPERIQKKREIILLVEDDPGLRPLLREILEAEGYEVIEATDGLDGMVTSRSKTPGLVITDLMMPTIGGEDLLHDIKQLFPKTPVVVMSGAFAVDSDKGIQVMKQGAAALLAKPFSSEDIIQTVKRTLSRTAKREP